MTLRNPKDEVGKEGDRIQDGEANTVHQGYGGHFENAGKLVKDGVFGTRVNLNHPVNLILACFFDSIISASATATYSGVTDLRTTFEENLDSCNYERNESVGQTCRNDNLADSCVPLRRVVIEFVAIWR